MNNSIEVVVQVNKRLYRTCLKPDKYIKNKYGQIKLPDKYWSASLYEMISEKKWKNLPMLDKKNNIKKLMKKIIVEI